MGWFFNEPLMDKGTSYPFACPGSYPPNTAFLLRVARTKIRKNKNKNKKSINKTRKKKI
jgi:hypothetical protein